MKLIKIDLFKYLFLENPMNKKIFVGNLPFRYTEDEVRSVFTPYGDILEIVVIKDRYTGQQKGFCFIEFKTQEAAQNALKMDGKDFQGRTLRVSFADKDKNRSGKGGRRERE
jgi:cold-inducible RNA-binding protein